MSLLDSTAQTCQLKFLKIRWFLCANRHYLVAFALVLHLLLLNHLLLLLFVAFTALSIRCTQQASIMSTSLLKLSVHICPFV